MKKRILSFLLVLTMMATALPVAGMAAEGVPTFSTWRAPWLYSAKANMADAEGKTVQGENIREENEILVFDLGDVQMGTTGEKKLELTFENVSEVQVPEVNPNNYGQVNLSTSRETESFRIRWDKGDVTNRILKSKGETATVTVTVKDSASYGVHEEPILFMEQESRVGWFIKVKVNIVRGTKNATVTTQELTHEYGQSVKPTEIFCKVEGSDVSVTLDDLGVKKLPNDYSTSPVGVYTISFDTEVFRFDHYDLHVNGQTTLNVGKATPHLVSAIAPGVQKGRPLSDCELIAKFTNINNGALIEGSIKWDTPDVTVEDGKEYKYTFTPNDTVNYSEFHGSQVVSTADNTTTGGWVSGAIDVDEDSLIRTYDGSRKNVTFTCPEAVRANVQIWYRAKGTNGWYQDRPVDVGTYDVKLYHSGGYYGGNHYTSSTVFTEMTILPADAAINVAMYTHYYDGGRGPVQVASISVSNRNVQLADETGNALTPADAAKYFEGFFENSETGSDKPVTVRLKEGMAVTLTGSNAKNYKMPETIAATAELAPQPVLLELKDDVSKYYGQTMEFVNSDFNSKLIKNGAFVSNESMITEILQISAISEGTAPTANVAAYKVYASGHGSGYTVTQTSGEFEVLPAVPECVSVSSGYGHIGDVASTIEGSLQGTFRNPYSGEAVQGTVELDSASKDIILDKETAVGYVFTPSDGNHTSYAGTVTVTSSEKKPVDLMIADHTSFIYNGMPQAVTAVSSDTGSITVEYEVDGTYTDKAPTDVGEYKVRVTAKGSGSYADNVIETTMIITPATPTGTAAVTEPEDGALLSEVVLTPMVTGVNGEVLTGSISWDSVANATPDEITVVRGEHYNWTFTPDSANYTSIKGANLVLPELPPEEEKDPGTTPGDPGTTPSDPGTTPGDPGTTPSDPGTTPGDPGTTPSDPGTTPSDPGTTPSDPGTTPSDPGTTPGDPGTTPSDPGTTPGDPGTTPSDPGTTPSDPGTTPSDPGTTPGDPGTTPSDPGTTPSDPGTTPSNPGTTPSNPGTTPGNPGSTGGTGGNTTTAEKPTLTPEVKADESGAASVTVDKEAVASGIGEARESGAGSVVIAPKVSGGAGKVTVGIPAESAHDMADAGLGVEIKTDLANVTLAASAVTGLSRDGAAISVTVSKSEEGTRLQVMSGSALVDKVDGGVSVTLPASKGSVLVLVGEDGKETVIRKSLVTGGEAKAVLDGSCTLKVVDTRSDFDDVGKFVDAVDFAVSHELFKGTSDSTFDPDGDMTRSMVATVLWRLENEAAASGTASFSDVADGKWYSQAVSWASDAGIISGYTDGSFGADDPVSREQLAVMLYRYAVKFGVDTSGKAELGAFTDSGSAAPYAVDALKWAVGSGIMQGKGSDILDPSGSASRVEVAIMLQRLVALLIG